MSSVTIATPNENQQVSPPFNASGSSSGDTNMMSAVVVDSMNQQVVPGGQQQNFTSDKRGMWSVLFPTLAITPSGQTYTLKVTKGDFTANVDFTLIQV